MSPAQIKIILHHYSSPEAYSGGMCQKFVLSEERAFVDLRLMEASMENNSGLKLTLLGKAYVRMLLATPFPVDRYVDPRTNEIIEPD